MKEFYITDKGICATSLKASLSTKTTSNLSAQFFRELLLSDFAVRRTRIFAFMSAFSKTIQYSFGGYEFLFGGYGYKEDGFSVKLYCTGSVSPVNLISKITE